MKLRLLLILGVAASCRAADVAPNSTLDALLAEKDRWHQLKGMLDYSDTLSAPQAADAVHYIEAHNISESHDEPLQLFVHRWAELDPAGAAAATQAMMNDARLQSLFICEVYPLLARKKPDDALAQARQLTTGANRDEAIRLVFYEMAKQDPLHALAKSETLPQSLRNQVLYPVFKSWAARDPVSATQAALQFPDRQQGIALVEAVGDGLNSVNPGRMRAWAAELPEGWAHETGERAVVNGLVLTNLAGAADYVATLPPGSAQDLMLWLVAVQWALHDPQGALDYMLKLPLQTRRTMAIHQILETLRQSDPHSALMALDSLPPSADVGAQRQQLLVEWASRDPEAAVEYARRLSGDNTRRAALAALAPSLAYVNPRHAMALVTENASTEDRARLQTQVGSTWVARDPQGAVAFASNLPDNQREEYLASIAGSWIVIDAPTAGHWLDSISDTALKVKIVESIGQQWAMSDPDGAVRALNSLPPGADRDSFLHAIADRKASFQPAQTVAWANQLPDPDRKVAAAAAVFRWALEDPVSAAKYVAANPDAPGSSVGLPIVADQLARTDAKAALAWLQAFPDSNARLQAYTNVMGEWANLNRDGAEAWLQQQPPGPTRDAITRAYTIELQRKEPEAAYRWARIIQNPNLRDDTEWDVLRAWQRKDKMAADAHVAASDLSQARKNDLLGIPNPVAKPDPWLPH